MRKQLKKLLSSLLALTMLLSVLPAAMLAEAGEEAAVYAEATAMPEGEAFIGLDDEPAGDPEQNHTAEPGIDSVIEGDIEAPEITPESAGDLEQDSAAEPGIDSAIDGDMVAPEITPEPAQSGLTDAQQAALNALPKGFSAQVVAVAMLSSTGCQHTNLEVWDDYDIQFTRIDDERHSYTIKYTTRNLICCECDETLQTVPYNKTDAGEEAHIWARSVSSVYDYVCSGCGATKTVEPPCAHDDFYTGEDGNLYCRDCGAVTKVYPGSTSVDCKHTNYTVYYPEKEFTEYSQWDADSHLKKTTVWLYYNASDTYDGICNDCGISIVCKANGDFYYCGNTSEVAEGWRYASVLEAHSFENGACRYCGEVQTAQSCPHAETKRVENTAKQTVELKSADADKHTIVTTKYFELRCAACDAYIGDGDTDVSTDEQAHTMNAQNVCEVCGYGSSCTHNYPVHYVKGDTYTAYKWTGNGDTHYVIMHDVLAECYYCHACKKFYLSDAAGNIAQISVSEALVISERERYIEDCYLTNGWTQEYYSCNYCGHIKGEVEPGDCDHSNRNYENVLDESVAPKYTNITETTHCVQRSYKRYCKDCNAYVGDVLDEGIEPVAHDFGAGDTCVCGYKKDKEEPCAHAELEKLEMGTKASYKRIDGDGESHETTRTQYYGMFCKACGELVSMADPVVTSGKEKHDWKGTAYNNGVSKCIYCGYAEYENATKGAYYTALKEFESSENPLKEGSPVRAIMLSELTRIGYSRTYAEEIIARAAAAPETYRDIFVYSFFEYERENCGKAQFSIVTNTISCPMEKDITTFFHESGHAADFQLAREGKEKYTYSNRSELFEALGEDLRNFLEFTAYKSPYKFSDSTPKESIQKVIDAIIDVEIEPTKTNYTFPLVAYDLQPSNDFTEQEKKVYSELVSSVYDRLKRGANNNTDMASDIMTGLTKRILYSKFGHDYTYWAEGDTEYTAAVEAWAEWFSSQMYGESEYVNNNRTYFPKATEVLDIMATEMAEHYRTMVRES